jgi:hypothetical protein
MSLGASEGGYPARTRGLSARRGWGRLVEAQAIISGYAGRRSPVPLQGALVLSDCGREYRCLKAR